MHRFFVEGVRELGDEVALAADDARKARVVLRLRDGDRIEIADSGSQAFVASVAIRGETVVATLAEAIPDARGEALRVDVAQAVPKGRKMDFVVEKLTELGVARIVPFVSQRARASSAGAGSRARPRSNADAATFPRLPSRPVSMRCCRDFPNTT
jgi:16S rRNA (uracil1498-N3)-methyltransferase